MIVALRMRTPTLSQSALPSMNFSATVATNFPAVLYRKSSLQASNTRFEPVVVQAPASTEEDSPAPVPNSNLLGAGNVTPFGFTAAPNCAQSPATAPDWPAGPMSRSATRRPGPLADQRNVVCSAGAPSASARSRTMLSGRPSSASLLSFAQSGMASAAYSVSVRNAVTRTAAPSGPARS